MYRLFYFDSSLLWRLWLAAGTEPERPCFTASFAARRRDGRDHWPVSRGAQRPWKFTEGDSPTDPATHKPLWAEPDFDDRQWENMDLTPKQGSTHPISGESGYVPGWTTKGHPGYWGFAWYRIRVRTEAQPGRRMALLSPSDVDDDFQVFANGVLLGSFGDFSANPPVSYYAQPRMFPLPQATIDTTEAGTGNSRSLVLAFRVWMEPYSLVGTAGSGGLHGPPILGDAASVAAGYQSQWLGLIQSYAGSAVEHRRAAQSLR